MGATGTAIGDDARRLLVAHYQFYRSLDTGARVPETAAQHHFVAVCRRSAPPETDHERAYSQFKEVVAAAGVSEETVVACGFELALVGASDAVEVVDVPVRLCAGCGRPIPPERLEALPAATRCVSCQQRSEEAPSDWRVSEVGCPRCAADGFHARMVWRVARDPTVFTRYFLGCSRFPECRYVDRA